MVAEEVAEVYPERGRRTLEATLSKLSRLVAERSRSHRHASIHFSFFFIPQKNKKHSA